MKIIGIIGGGNMGEALIKGLYGARQRVLLCETNPGRAAFLKSRYKVSLEKDISSLSLKADIVILAVKPQDMGPVLEQIKTTKGRLFISIAAGLTTAYFEERLGNKARVVRAMPNLPAIIGLGTVGFCKGRFVTAADLKAAQGILRAFVGEIQIKNNKGAKVGVGAVVPFDESKLDAITAVSGSGPAYVFLFVECWMKAAMELGLGEKEAKRFVEDTLIGSALLLKGTGFAAGTAGELRAKVTSKGGTTEAAMKVFLKENIFANLMDEALTAAMKRARELAK